jgi:hypothetical protein
MGRHVQKNPWAWQMLIFLIAYGWFHLVYDPFLWIYRANNKHVSIQFTQRTLEYTLTKEREYKKKMKDVEDAAEAAKAAETATAVENGTSE